MYAEMTIAQLKTEIERRVQENIPVDAHLVKSKSRKADLVSILNNSDERIETASKLANAERLKAEKALNAFYNIDPIAADKLRSQWMKGLLLDSDVITEIKLMSVDNKRQDARTHITVMYVDAERVRRSWQAQNGYTGNNPYKGLTQRQKRALERRLTRAALYAYKLEMA